jgi:hypothetical protein
MNAAMHVTRGFDFVECGRTKGGHSGLGECWNRKIEIRSTSLIFPIWLSSVKDGLAPNVSITDCMLAEDTPAADRSRTITVNRHFIMRER